MKLYPVYILAYVIQEHVYQEVWTYLSSRFRIFKLVFHCFNKSPDHPKTHICICRKSKLFKEIYSSDTHMFVLLKIITFIFQV